MGGDGIARGGLSSQFYMYLNRRSVPRVFWPDWQKAGLKRGGLREYDCMLLGRTEYISCFLSPRSYLFGIFKEKKHTN